MVPFVERDEKCLVRNLREEWRYRLGSFGLRTLYIVICAFIPFNQRKRDAQSLEKEVGLSCIEEQDCQKRFIFQTCRSIHTRKQTIYDIYIERERERVERDVDGGRSLLTDLVPV